MTPPDNIPLGAWSGSDATDRLRVTIEQFNQAANRQTTQLVRLTWVLVVLTALLLIGLIAQIALAVWG